MTRRNVVSSIAAGAGCPAQPPRPKTWKPKLGVLGKFSEANLQFAKEDGFRSMGLWADARPTLDVTAPVTDAKIAEVKASIARSQLHISVLGNTQNHIKPDMEARARS